MPFPKGDSAVVGEWAAWKRPKTAMYKRRIAEISLRQVSVKVAGGRQNRTGQHLFAARLVWPRPAIADKVSVKTLDFNGNQCDLGKSDWITGILFKETVQGPFGLEVTLTEQLSSSQLGKFLEFISASFFKFAGSEATDLSSSSLGSSLTKVPFDFLSKHVSGKSKTDAKWIAAGSLNLLTEQNVKAGKGVEHEILLTTPEPICRITRVRRHGELSTKKRTLLGAGQENGSAVISVKFYD
jgi:hypothetical protein